MLDGLCTEYPVLKMEIIMPPPHRTSRTRRTRFRWWNNSEDTTGLRNAMSCALLTCHLTIYCRIWAAATELGDRGTGGFLCRRTDTTCSSGRRSRPGCRSACRANWPTRCTARCTTTAAAAAGCRTTYAATGARPTTCLVPLAGQTFRRAGNWK